MTSLFFFAVLVGSAKALFGGEWLPVPRFNVTLGNTTDILLSCSTYTRSTTQNASLDWGTYSLRAFSPNVTPIYMDVGSNASHLQWNVPFPPDSQVLLGMLDGKGHSGNVQGPFRISGAENSSCTPPSNGSSTSSFKVTTNTTSPKSCEPVGIFISGGSRPYHATIVIEGVGFIARALNAKDDVYTWFNVAPLGRQVIFSAEDHEGKLAVSSPIIVSAGDSILCPFASYSGNPSRSWSKARRLFYYFGIFLPFTLMGLAIGLYLLYMAAYFVYHWLRRFVVSLRRGDEESGSVSGGAADDTRPNTPVGPALQQDNDHTNIGPATGVVAPQITAPSTRSSLATLPPYDDADDETKAGPQSEVDEKQ